VSVYNVHGRPSKLPAPVDHLQCTRDQLDFTGLESVYNVNVVREALAGRRGRLQCNSCPADVLPISMPH